jgi:hypothetical protein
MEHTEKLQREDMTGGIPDSADVDNIGCLLLLTRVLCIFI